MTEEERTRELEHIKENLLMIKQIIGEHRNNYDDALTQLGRIMARTEFALDSVENLKGEIRSVGNGKRIIAKLKNGGIRNESMEKS